MKSVQPTLDYLYGLQKFGMKLGLRNISALLRTAGNPHKQFRSVHIAGTNGKGSTSSMIAAALTAAGYNVGLYTSPHLVRFNERIRIDGKMISDGDLVRYAKMFRREIDGLHATFFEATTAIAFKYFKDSKIDIAVVETGLGGRLDATNVLIPIVSVITSIAKDHTEHLGTSIKKIAFEKGGIIKRGVVCVSGVASRAAVRELQKASREKNSPLIEVNRVTSRGSATRKGHTQICTITTRNSSYPSLEIPLLGEYQIQNARVALVALEQLSVSGFAIPPSSVAKGFQELQRLTGIRGRFEILREKPDVILDVAHNPDGISALIGALKAYRYGRLLIVFGVMKDKNYAEMIRILATLDPIVFAVRPAIERALEPEKSVTLFQKRNCNAQGYHILGEGVRSAVHAQRKSDLLLICGSHYLAGEALPMIEKELRRKSS